LPLTLDNRSPQITGEGVRKALPIESRVNDHVRYGMRGMDQVLRSWNQRSSLFPSSTLSLRQSKISGSCIGLSHLVNSLPLLLPEKPTQCPTTLQPQNPSPPPTLVPPPPTSNNPSPTPKPELKLNNPNPPNPTKYPNPTQHSHPPPKPWPPRPPRPCPLPPRR
jgi:hypothetical protein